jgi:hypothetical protein
MPGNLGKSIAADPPSSARLKKLTKPWHACVALERDFCDSGLKINK